MTLVQQRERALPEWPFNLFCTVCGESREALARRVEEIARLPALSSYARDVLLPQPHADARFA